MTYYLTETLAQNGITTSAPTISRYLKGMEITQKRLSIVPRERNNPRIIDLRQEFCHRINNIQAENLVFLDETRFNLHTKQNYGYSQKNTKCFYTLPKQRRNITDKGKQLYLPIFKCIWGPR